jgi:hypothetical protein
MLRRRPALPVPQWAGAANVNNALQATQDRRFAGQVHADRLNAVNALIAGWRENGTQAQCIRIPMVAGANGRRRIAPMYPDGTGVRHGDLLLALEDARGQPLPMDVMLHFRHDVPPFWGNGGVLYMVDAPSTPLHVRGPVVINMHYAGASVANVTVLQPACTHVLFAIPDVNERFALAKAPLVLPWPREAHLRARF